MAEMAAYRILDGAKFIDCYRLWRASFGVSNEDRLRSLLSAGGVKFFDDSDGLYVSRPSVGIIGIGGIPVRWSDTLPENRVGLSLYPGESVSLEHIRLAHIDMMGWGGFCTYLNPKDVSTREMVKIMTDAGHISTAHMVTINVMVLGVSTAVENEFNSQRDLIHLARLTEARTMSQKSPSVVVLYPELVPLFENVLRNTRDLVKEKEDIGNTVLARNDYLEATNTAYPAAKATMFILTSSLRNLQKLVPALSDRGKEEEYKRILALMNDSLASIWTDLFVPTERWGYSYPEHFATD